MSIKFLHIIPPYSIQAYPLLKMLNDNFDEKDHNYLIMATRKWTIDHTPKLLAFLNLIYLSETNKYFWSKIFQIYEIKRLLDEAEHIVLHSHFGIKGKFIILLFCQKKYIQKMIWIENWHDMFHWKKKDRKFKTRIRNYLFEKMLNNIPFVGMTLPTDQVGYSGYIKGNAQCFFTPTPVLKSYYESLNIEMSNESVKKNKPIILIGGDSLPENRHEQVFKILSKYKEEDASFITLMNYSMYGENGYFGSKNYRIYVNKRGRQIFNSKYVTLSKLNVNREKYFQTICRVDVAIFAGGRPISLNLLWMLLAAGKKVFMPGESPFYKYLLENNVPVYDLNLIKDMSFQDFIAPLDRQESPWLKNVFDDKTAAEHWNKLFEEASSFREDISK